MGLTVLLIVIDAVLLAAIVGLVVLKRRSERMPDDMMEAMTAPWPTLEEALDRICPLCLDDTKDGFFVGERHAHARCKRRGE